MLRDLNPGTDRKITYERLLSKYSNQHDTGRSESMDVIEVKHNLLFSVKNYVSITQKWTVKDEVFSAGPRNTDRQVKDTG